MGIPGASVGTDTGKSVGPKVDTDELGIGLLISASARHTGESLAFGRQSTKHSSPPRKHIEPGCSTESLPGPCSSSMPLQI